ncbi:invasion associated locus B family protein [Bradyrhizobium ganzhouense]|uniref:invasion associated locus B family protein n=1 Tax=Bradyrhizobium ganzhouense TaxID=1179767 RepID=UPI003CF65E4A
MKLAPLVLAITFFAAGTHSMSAVEVETKREFGIWTVKCVKQPAGALQADCSMVTGGVAPDDPTHWAKVGITMVGHNSPSKMTLRVPGFTPVGDGISVGFDGQQFGRVFIRNCDFANRVCETTFDISPDFQSMLLKKSSMSVEYKFDADKTTYIEFDLKNMLDATAYLANLADPASAAMAYVPGGTTTGSKSSTTTGAQTTASSAACCESDTKNEALQFIVERRKSPYNYRIASFSRVWDAPLQKCPSLPDKKEVAVNIEMSDGRFANVSYKVENEPSLKLWLNQSTQCSQDQEPVFWIRVKQPASGREVTAANVVNPVSLASQALYRTVTKAGAVAGIVPSEGVAPTLPSQTGMIESDSRFDSFNSIK